MDAREQELLQELTGDLPCVVFSARYASPDALPRYAFVSANAKQVLGVDADAIVRDPNAHFQTVLPEDLTSLRAEQRIAAEKEQRWRTEFRIRVDGRVRWVERHARFRRTPGAGLLESGYFADMTELEHRNRMWSHVVEQSSEGIFVCDPQERILMVNPAFEELTGFSASEALGKTPRMLSSGRQNASFYAELWENVTTRGKWQGEIWNRRKNGQLFAEWLSISAVHGEDGSVAQYVGIFSDITERKVAEERVIHLAQYDALTDLPNRILLIDRLAQALKSAERNHTKVGCIFLDLDHFKAVNDSLGHDVGDLLLQNVARRLSSTVRAGDTVARIGGDEFVVVLPELHGAEDAATVASKLLEALVPSLTGYGAEIRVTASMGIAIFPDHAANAHDLLKNADSAMYQVKKAGRNAYRFYAPIG